MTSALGTTRRPSWLPRPVQYLLVSGVALGLDWLLFTTLLSTGLGPPWAAAAGYSSGLIVHWLLSSGIVFRDRRAPTGAARTQQMLLFVGSALCGLAITSAVMTGGVWLGADPRWARLLAIGLSFVTTYLLRSRVVFR